MHSAKRFIRSRKSYFVFAYFAGWHRVLHGVVGFDFTHLGLKIEYFWTFLGSHRFSVGYSKLYVIVKLYIYTNNSSLTKVNLYIALGYLLFFVVLRVYFYRGLYFYLQLFISVCEFLIGT